jgi:hypothetical protein
MANGLATHSGFPRTEQTFKGELSRPFISYFPFGAPDERIDSRVARYHCLEAHRGVDMTYRRLFDALPFSLSQPIPSRLDKLAERLPGDQFENLEELYSRSTLLPLYEQFGGDKYQKNERKELLRNIANFARTVTVDGVSTCICPRCIVDDEEEHGWPYIHRAHHVPGVTACWRHGVALLSECENCRCPFQPPLGLPLGPWQGCVSCKSPLGRPDGSDENGVREIDLEYAKFAKALLDAAPINVSSDILSNLYRYQALKLGYGKKSVINRRAILEAIEDKFGAACLEKFDPDYRTNRSDAWFHVLGRQNGEVPVARHLFLALFLFGDAENLIKKLRLLAAGKLAHVASLRKVRRRRLVKAKSPVEVRKKVLLNELASFARSENLTVEGLWKARYGDMKRLVKKQPDAVAILQKQIKAPVEMIEPIRKAVSKRPQNRDDAEWVKKIAEVLPGLYAPDKFPMRVSVNVICQAAAFSRCVDEATSPLTYAALKLSAETIWYFYARRILWNVQVGNGNPVTRYKAIYGLDFYRAVEVYDFLMGRLDELCKEGTAISEALASIGIVRDWVGPCPGKELRRAGRAYQKVGR